MPGTRIEAAELRELAGSGTRVTVRPGIDDLGRLAELLATDGAGAADPVNVVAEVAVRQGPEGYPQLAIAINGELSLRCQRCLQSVSYPLDLRSRLTVLTDDGNARQLAEPFESILMEDGELVLETVIEDEILAALPMAPAHGVGEGCEPAVPDAVIENETGRTHRPFAELATMVGGGEDGHGD